MSQNPDAGLRQTAFRVVAGSSLLVMDLQTDATLGVLMHGLRDAGRYQCEFVVHCSNIKVDYSHRLSQRPLLHLRRVYLSSSDVHQIAQHIPEIYHHLDAPRANQPNALLALPTVPTGTYATQLGPRTHTR